MSRLIDADAYKDKLRELFRDVRGGNEAIVMAYEEAITDAWNALDEQPTVNEWVSCSEKLLEDDNYYLTTVIHAYSDCDDYSNVCKTMFYDGEWQTDLKLYKVIAWMPLPKPWEDE